MKRTGKLKWVISSAYLCYIGTLCGWLRIILGPDVFIFDPRMNHWLIQCLYSCYFIIQMALSRRFPFSAADIKRCQGKETTTQWESRNGRAFDEFRRASMLMLSKQGAPTGRGFRISGTSPMVFKSCCYKEVLNQSEEHSHGHGRQSTEFQL